MKKRKVSPVPDKTDHEWGNDSRNRLHRRNTLYSSRERSSGRHHGRSYSTNGSSLSPALSVSCSKRTITPRGPNVSTTSSSSTDQHFPHVLLDGSSSSSGRYTSPISLKNEVPIFSKTSHKKYHSRKDDRKDVPRKGKKRSHSPISPPDNKRLNTSGHESQYFSSTTQPPPKEPFENTSRTFYPEKQHRVSRPSYTDVRKLDEDQSHSSNPFRKRRNTTSTNPESQSCSSTTWQSSISSSSTALSARQSSLMNQASQFIVNTHTISDDKQHGEEMSMPMSYTWVKKLCEDAEENSAEETAIRLTEKSMFKRFESLLASEQDIRYDLMKLVISLIEIVCRSRTESHSNQVLAMIQKVNFWEHLGKFIGELFSTNEAVVDPELGSMIINLCKICRLSLDRLPHLQAKIPVSQLKDAVEFFREEGNLADSAIHDLLDDLNTKRQNIMKGLRDRNSSLQQPPNDFRALSVFPIREDIFTREKPFLRANLVKRSFSSVEHYLDVQFRLLKEDSLAELRDGVRNLREQDRQKEFQYDRRPNEDKRKDRVKVFYDVKINEVVPSKYHVDGIVHNVSFNANHSSIKGTNWKRSKRLIAGSLVCLLSKDFQTLYFATVQYRSADMLEKGLLQLCFEGDEIPSPGHDYNTYRMVENTSAYFMAYRHILKRLQEITEETMPFKNYIVSCEREINKAAYLERKTTDESSKKFDLTTIADQSKLVNEDDKNNREAVKNVDPSDLSTWPSAEVFGLNESQYRAFQSAITKEFVVIQGPPGTGKTYLGLKIAHALLANRKLWKDDENESCPILMVAYTNHALDQFLEGLSIDKEGIIRVGGRSSSKILENRNLNIVRRNHDDCGLSTASKRKQRTVYAIVQDCKETLRRYSNLYSQSLKGILPARSFLQVLSIGDLQCIHEILEEEYLQEEIILDFLNITLKPKAQTNYSVESDDEFEFAPEDNEGHFSAAKFDANEDNEFKRDKVVICFADEATKPEEIMSYIKESDDDAWVDLVTHRAQHFGLRELNVRERWCLYRLWLSKFHEALDRKIKEELARHLELTTELEELNNVVDLNILRSAHVVGMTTTCASKNHKLLRLLRPRIMIIEEAAEVFEAHVVSCLTEYCQHLILIGDHQQLRPKPSVYNLSVKYHLDVSLLERMIEAGVPYNRLSLQHRMRPEISQVMRHIYQDLDDHSSVTQYEDVKGISKNVYFIDHCEHEGVRDNIHSKTNTYEASFLVALCHYLLHQGYDSSQVTILTTYTGQMFEIRDLIKKDWSWSGIPRVSCVDNFQGEENDIILLSLVRNNIEENIGFLKTENRVCVALSRAKKGLYILGNERILTKQSPLWKSVLGDLKKSNCIGEHLPLVCINHGTESLVSSDKDFAQKVPNGGCLKPCRFRLECGHACPQMCHPDGHESFLCQKPCERPPTICKLQSHKCTQLCHESCDYHCQYRVETTLPCGHLAELACSDDERMADCKEQCEKILQCGHRCQDYCGKPCTKKCLELVKTTDWSCGHENTMACSATQKACPIECKALLECGHICTGKCGLCIQGRVHVKCKQKCERPLICSHLCKASCTKNCPPCKVQCTRECKHSKCEKPCGEICIPCQEPCDWECDHFKCNKLCSQMCDRPRCDEPCNRKLNCATKEQRPHYCRGLCSERCVCVICDKNNKEDITKTFFGTEDEENARFIRLKDCEHIFEYTALDQWMDLNEDGDEIKVKVCPLCNQPIEKTLRYGNIVKQIHQDIDNVKRKLLKKADDIKDRKESVEELIYEVIRTFCKAPAEYQYLDKFLQTTQTFLRKSSKVNYQDILLVESQLRLLKNVLLLKKSYKATFTDSLQFVKSPNQVKFLEEMDYIRSRIVVSPVNINMVMLQQIRMELERMFLKRDVLIFQNRVTNTTGVKLSETDEQLVEGIVEKLEGKEVIEDEVIEKSKQHIMEIYQQYPQLRIPISDEEKVQIVNAIGLKQGHWFKCSNGHCYAIGECGGAMEKSQCPECGAVIGGQQHHLEEGNELASEMDGAQHAAWSEQANLGNYQLI